MIIGIGCDLERVAAVEDAAALRVPGVFFTEAECDYAARQADAGASLAGQFAAKEAFFKSVGGAIDFYWTDLEVTHDARRAPLFRFSGSLAQKVEMNRWEVKLSISHSGSYATAFVTVSACQ
jgi:holo-[acyl-carrier protein] synthase